MENVVININVAAPYLSLKEYASISGIPFNTCREMVRSGRIIIRPKKRANERVEVNMVAMLRDAINNAE